MFENLLKAYISITVTSFTPVRADFLTLPERDRIASTSAATLKLKVDETGRVREDYPHPGEFTIKIAGGPLALVLYAERSLDHEYAPIGIAFTKEDLHALMPDNGMLAFPDRWTSYDLLTGKTRLTIVNRPLVAASFKYYIILQQDDGVLGVVDPHLNNA